MSTEVNVTVIHGSDDCYVYDYPTPTTMRLTYDYLYLGYQCIAGVRFQSVNVPKGVTIEEAYITFRAHGQFVTDIDDLYVYGEDVDSAAAYSTVANFNGRDRTTEKVLWTLGSWTVGVDYNTPDLTAIVQEIIDRAGWAANQDMAFFVQHEGSSTKYKQAKSYEEDTTYCARLYIRYAPPVVALAGVAAGVASVSGSIAVARSLAGISAGVAGVSGFIKVARALSGVSAGVASVSANLLNTVWLRGVIAGVSSVTGKIRVARALSGVVAGVATVSGFIRVARALAGSSAGSSVVTGALFHVRKAIRTLAAVRNLLAVRNIPPVR